MLGNKCKPCELTFYLYVIMFTFSEQYVSLPTLASSSAKASPSRGAILHTDMLKQQT